MERRASVAGVLLEHHLPKEVHEEIERAVKAHMAAATALIQFLDLCDGDTDREPVSEDEGADNERDASFPETHGAGSHGGYSDSEDDEHSLGWTEGVDQARALRQSTASVLTRDGVWLHANSDDEAEHDGREPSLGANEAMDQSAWGRGVRDDRERDGDKDECSEHEIGRRL